MSLNFERAGTIVCLLVILCFPVFTMAQASSENYSVTKSVFDVSGSLSNSENHNHLSAIGQPMPVGTQTSVIYSLYSGVLIPLLESSPLTPIQRLAITESGADVVLYWEARAGAGNYSIYRDATLHFTPSEGNLVVTTADTAFTDSGVLSGPALQQYYIVIANP